MYLFKRHNLNFLRFNRLPLAKIRAEFMKQKFNLLNTVEALEADLRSVRLKNKRRSYSYYEISNHKKTENIEFLKEVIIKFNLLNSLVLLSSN